MMRNRGLYFVVVVILLVNTLAILTLNSLYQQKLNFVESQKVIVTSEFPLIYSELRDEPFTSDYKMIKSETVFFMYDPNIYEYTLEYYDRMINICKENYCDLVPVPIINYLNIGSGYINASVRDNFQVMPNGYLMDYKSFKEKFGSTALPAIHREGCPEHNRLQLNNRLKTQTITDYIDIQCNGYVGSAIDVFIVHNHDITMEEVEKVKSLMNKVYYKNLDFTLMKVNESKFSPYNINIFVDLKSKNDVGFKRRLLRDSHHVQFYDGTTKLFIKPYVYTDIDITVDELNAYTGLDVDEYYPCGMSLSERDVKKYVYGHCFVKDRNGKVISGNNKVNDILLNYMYLSKKVIK